MQVETFLYSASLWLLPVLLAITLHEVVHVMDSSSKP
jgi:hypothetical protein